MKNKTLKDRDNRGGDSYLPGKHTAKTAKQIAALLFLAVAAMTAHINYAYGQTFRVLYSFTGWLDDANPYGRLVLSGDALFGTTSGADCCTGSVFSLKTNGANFLTLHNFDWSPSSAGGYSPQAGLVLFDGTLYGTAAGGGTNRGGTVFSLRTNGANFRVVYSLGGSNGSSPRAGLLLADGKLYGTTFGNSSDGQNGTVFSVTTNGGGFSVLHTMTTDSGGFPGTNMDGSRLYGAVVSSGDTLYGTAASGGVHGFGTVFSVRTNGANFRVLHAFAAANGFSGGASPASGLVLSEGTLYGAATWGGTFGAGTIFSVRTNGTGFRVLYSFNGSDGSSPEGDLLLSGNNGTVFSINTNGTGFKLLHQFSTLAQGGSGQYTNQDGANPVSGLTLFDKTLYGTAMDGGPYGHGTVFSISLPLPPAPRITSVDRAGPNLVINATNGVAGGIYSILMGTNVSSPVSQWTAVASRVLTATGNFNITVTNAFDPSAAQRFYILRCQEP
jgi:uncharacterized repeat protein (TIGR03803 family)